MALGWPWRALGVLLVLPRPLRDAAYDFVARRRYRWYGRRESCRMPTPALRARFLD
jgi:predicted DCC family thiol-disulfide oxidoreductase YuxK